MTALTGMEFDTSVVGIAFELVPAASSAAVPHVAITAAVGAANCVQLVAGLLTPGH